MERTLIPVFRRENA